MNPLPDFNERGDLPQGIHPVALSEVLVHFGKTGRRAVIGRRLERIHTLAGSTGHLSRFVVFGSFVKDKAEPNDVDIFMLMEDSFDVRQVPTEIRLVFDHAAALGGEEAMIAHWQIKRDGGKRGIIEITRI
jgi:hypothetical protein